MRNLIPLIISFFFIHSFCLFSQAKNGSPDSSEILLKSNLIDSVKVQRLYKLNARRLSNGEFEPVRKASPGIIAIAKELKNPKWYGESVRFYAISFERLGQPDSAIKYYYIALNHAKKNGMKKIEGHCYHNIGLALYSQSSFEEALKAYISAERIREEIKDTIALGWTLNNIGLIYWRQHSRRDAMIHFRKARELFKAKQFVEGLAISTSNIGLINEELNQHDSAI
ncbi:MAG: tetratricopeptide repeat protein, partial [Bacteroidia bacterium]